MQLLNLSGILTVFICGILMSHYAWYNVTESSKVTTRYFWIKDPFILCFLWFIPFLYLSLICTVQACFCNDVICCRDIHISVCWDGCTWYWKVEVDKIKVDSVWFIKSLKFLLVYLKNRDWVLGFDLMQFWDLPGYVRCNHNADISGTCCFCVPTFSLIQLR